MNRTPSLLQRLLCLAVLCFLAAGNSYLDGLVASDASQDLETGIQSWTALKRDAGYFTASGRWRGGFPYLTRDEWYETFTCENIFDSYCYTWYLVEVDWKAQVNGTCYCTHHSKGEYCKAWECTKRDRFRRIRCSPDGTNCRFKALKRGKASSCWCWEPAQEKKYCQKWSCEQKQSFTKEPKTRNFTCIEEDGTRNYCFRWNSSTSTVDRLFSSVCQCFDRGPQFCHHWKCKQRKITICDKHSGYWCDYSMSLFLGGPAGVLTMILVIYIRPILNNTIPKLLYVAFRSMILASSWLCAVLVWGGTRALPWVLPSWIFTFLMLSFYLMYRVKRKYGKLMWIQSQVPELKVDTEMREI